MPKQQILVLHGNDSVAVALQPLAAGTLLETPCGPVTTKRPIPAGHKLAIRDVLQDQQVFKYGWPIGRATQTIGAGEHVHTHNLRSDHRASTESLLAEVAFPANGPPASSPSGPAAGSSRSDTYSFMGYRRPGGGVGTRNYIAVISTVNCSASVARMIADRFDQESLARFPNVDGVLAFRHHGGCGMSFESQQHKLLNRVLAGIARHPNIGGYCLIGLGCEQGTLSHLIGDQKLVPMPAASIGRSSASAAANQPPTLVMQELGGTRATVEAGVELIERLLPQVDQARREQTAASHLVLATECGGSDAYSGITANPVVGAAADLLVSHGGTVILSETSEIYGAEQLLVRRARSREVAEALLERIDWWKWYTGLFGEQIDGNPSVGNKAGGLTTIEEKSLGAVTKGGNSPLQAVYQYAEPVHQPGFVFMDTPGYDPVSVTGMVAGGANCVVFTTGRGSCFGSRPAPCLKVATNSQLFARMPEDMDFDAGPVLEGASIETAGAALLEQILTMASGQASLSEQLGLGSDEFIPWSVGPVL
jgi:altronate hydrolase